MSSTSQTVDLSEFYERSRKFAQKIGQPGEQWIGRNSDPEHPEALVPKKESAESNDTGQENKPVEYKDMSVG